MMNTSSVSEEADEAQYESEKIDEINLKFVQQLPTHSAQLTALLSLQRETTQKLTDHGKCCPEYIYNRALVYRALEYDDLAAFDAYTVYLLALKHLSPDDFITDLEAHDADARPWRPSKDKAREVLLKAMRTLVSCLDRLSATRDAAAMLGTLSRPPCCIAMFDPESNSFPDVYRNYVDEDSAWSLSSSEKLHEPVIRRTSLDQATGLSRREIYPWSKYEPDRNSVASTHEINSILSVVAPKLEARVTILPDLTDPGKEWKQLGLFAKEDLAPGEEVLREKSIVTAIRPLEDAICDACGQDLEVVAVEERCECDGYDCDVTFCTQDCKDRAASEYHAPNLGDDDDDDDEEDCNSDDAYDDSQSRKGPDREVTEMLQEKFDALHLPRPSPFCSNEDNLNSIGRLQTTSTPESDLYFLLLTRTAAISITQQTHPLNLLSTKYLWGDFTPAPHSPHPRTLPFTLQHNIALPLEYFSTLALSHPAATPYSRDWLATFDSWILQTLYAKFRGVANATQSTFDGKAEIAMVHPMWCLANHSCEPNVEWVPSGVRRFRVRETRIARGEEVFSHYTDVRLDVVKRRERLMEVLGGECMCSRCIRESGEGQR